MLTLAGALIAISLFFPAATQAAGSVGVLVALVAVFAIMFKRPVGRPSGDATRRLSGYLVRPDVSAVPEAVLLGVSLWELGIASVPGIPPPPIPDLVFAGLVAGVAWGLASRFRAVAEVAAIVVGGVALLSSFRTLVTGDDCMDPLGSAAAMGMLVVLGASVAVAVLFGFWKAATLRRASVGAYLLALVGLIELMRFAIAPAGESILDDAPTWALLTLAAGCVLVAVSGSINPKATEALVGTGMAVGGGYLLIVGTTLDFDESITCQAFGRQLALVAAFTIGAFLTGGTRT